MLKLYISQILSADFFFAFGIKCQTFEYIKGNLESFLDYRLDYIIISYKKMKWVSQIILTSYVTNDIISFSNISRVQYI